MRGSNTDQISFFVKTNMRPARESPTGEDVLSRQHNVRCQSWAAPPVAN